MGTVLATLGGVAAAGGLGFGVYLLMQGKKPSLKEGLYSFKKGDKTVQVLVRHVKDKDGKWQVRMHELVAFDAASITHGHEMTYDPTPNIEGDTARNMNVKAKLHHPSLAAGKYYAQGSHKVGDRNVFKSHAFEVDGSGNYIGDGRPTPGKFVLSTDPHYDDDDSAVEIHWSSWEPKTE